MSTYLNTINFYINIEQVNINLYHDNRITNNLNDKLYRIKVIL